MDLWWPKTLTRWDIPRPSKPPRPHILFILGLDFSEMFPEHQEKWLSLLMLPLYRFYFYFGGNFAYFQQRTPFNRPR